MRFAALGDSAVVVECDGGAEASALSRVRALAAALTSEHRAGIDDVVPAYATVTVFYDPVRFAANETRPYEQVCHYIAERAALVTATTLGETESFRRIEIPVCYGGDHGPDLGLVAKHCGLSEEAVVAAHSGADYAVHAIGFAPGFPYLGGLPEVLHTPRRATPRTSVPAGSVGIGGAQTGVYPLATPGGWQLIGRTPLRLFDVARAEPALLRAGDRVTFRPIGEKEFAAWK